MPKNFKLTIEYDGTAYHGWQRQRCDNTIQAEIEKAITRITGEKVALIGSGRTDAGVHAFGQTANFFCETRLDADAIQKGLNALLPDDIVIRNCAESNSDFHARKNVQSKIYTYRILNRLTPSAIYRRYSWHVKKKLDLPAMQKAGEHLVGLHDFRAFQGQGSGIINTERRITSLCFLKEDDFIIIEMEGKGFLRFMVRNIVGTLVDVGRGKIAPDEFKQILDSRNRSKASATAPPHGLFLMEVKY